LNQNEFIELRRDVVATAIPSGNPMTLREGTPIGITQSLGGTYTVHVSGAPGLYRIKGEDSDALGQAAPAAHAMVEGPFDEENVWSQLKNCYDPEIPVNIVDLGLIYGLVAEDDPETGGKRVNVKMTLTAPGCGMGPAIAGDAEQRILTVPGVSSARVEVVWEPAWSPELISTAGRERLGMD
jgi:probable FeS assembly SUF system protein SufT